MFITHYVWAASVDGLVPNLAAKQTAMVNLIQTFMPVMIFFKTKTKTLHQDQDQDLFVMNTRGRPKSIFLFWP